MSYWTYITGVITVSPMGRTQPEKRYILDTVLDHLPAVTGSEANMKVHVVQKYGHNSSSSCNEFDESLWYRRDADHDGWMRVQDEYLLVLEGSLRDRVYEETFHAFNKWLNRLAKRVSVDDILVRINGYSILSDSYKSYTFCDAEPYTKMSEWPSWCEEESGGEPAWAEYLMWESAKGTRYPMKLEYKYYNNPENDAEYERRVAYAKEE